MSAAPATAKLESATVEKKKPVMLLRNSLKLLESTNQSFRAVVPRGVSRERLLDSDFWSVLAQDFRAYDRILIVAEDRTYVAELLVIDAGRGYCSCIEVWFKSLPPLLVSQDALPPNHAIEFGGPSEQYIVKRISDGVIMGKGFASRDAALQHLLESATLR